MVPEHPACGTPQRRDRSSDRGQGVLRLASDEGVRIDEARGENLHCALRKATEATSHVAK
ncbi:MAG: hypothetical protein A2138_14395 [Deltaproteobacteria bacterium RBG_16_71_12]|nr:MAG: hypothetical protein A2138_14395 [Deltaproteobacteria bacterium RBG_16_71_12]